VGSAGGLLCTFACRELLRGVEVAFREGHRCTVATRSGGSRGIMTPACAFVQHLLRHWLAATVFTIDQVIRDVGGHLVLLSF